MSFSLVNIDTMFFKGCFDSRVNMHLLPSDYISNGVNVGFNMPKVTWNTIITECFLGKNTSSRQLFSLNGNFQTVLLDSFNLIMGATESLFSTQSCS